MNSVANQTELVFEIAALNEGSAQNTQTRSEFRSADRLFNRKSANRLDWHPHRRNDLSQLIERTGIRLSHRREAATFIVPVVVNDVVAAKFLTPLWGRDPD